MSKQQGSMGQGPGSGTPGPTQQPKNAFALLLGKRPASAAGGGTSAGPPSSSGKRSKGAGSTPQEPVRQYVQCPMCSRSIPKLHIDLHIETCIASSQQQHQTQQQQHASSQLPQVQQPQQHQQGQGPLSALDHNKGQGMASATGPGAMAAVAPGHGANKGPARNASQHQLVQDQGHGHGHGQATPAHVQPHGAAFGAEAPQPMAHCIGASGAERSVQEQAEGPPGDPAPEGLPAGEVQGEREHGGWQAMGSQGSDSEVVLGDEEEEEEEEVGEEQFGLTQQQAGAATQSESRPTPGQQGLKGARGSSGGTNAFAALMKAQRAAASAARGPSHTFHLELHPRLGWRWFWWPTSAVPPTAKAGSRAAGSSSDSGSGGGKEGGEGAAAGEAPPCEPVWSVVTHVSEGRGQAAAAAAAASGPAAGSKAKTTLILQTNVPPGAGGLVTWDNPELPSNRVQPPAEGRWRGLPSGLKSALQKVVRLGRPGPAARIALQFLKDEGGPAELLRRLPVIVVEDALLHPALPLVVWLMAAQAKGYTLGALQATAVLHFTHQLATVPVRDYLPRLPPGRCPSSFTEVDEALPGRPQEAALVKCLLLRASYGGMTGDMQMLRGYASYWTARFGGWKDVAPPPSMLSLYPGEQKKPQARPQQQEMQGTPEQEPQQPVPTQAGAATAGAQCQSDGCGGPQGGGQQEPEQGAGTGAGAGAGAGAGQRHDRKRGGGDGAHGTGQREQGPKERQDEAREQQEEQEQGQGQQEQQKQGEQKEQQQRQQGPSPWLSFLMQAFAAGGPVPPELGSLRALGALRRADVPPSAVDFHVSDIGDTLLATPEVAAAANAITCASWGAEGDPRECLRSAIWLFRSSLNNRQWLPHLYSGSCGSTGSSTSGAAAQPGQVSQQGQRQEQETQETTLRGRSSRAGDSGGESGAAAAAAEGGGGGGGAGWQQLLQRRWPQAKAVHFEHLGLDIDLERDAAILERLAPLWAAAAAPADRYSQGIITRRMQG